MCQNRNILVKFNYSKDFVQYQFNLFIIDSNSLDTSSFIIPEKYDDKIFYSKKAINKLIERLDTVIKYSNDTISQNNKVLFEVSDGEETKSYSFSFPNHHDVLFNFLFGISKENKEDFVLKVLDPLNLGYLYEKWLEERIFNSCVYISFSYGNKKYSHHNLMLSTYTFLPIIDTNLLKEPLGILFFNYQKRPQKILDDWIFWEMPESNPLNSATIKLIDSLISNNKLPYIQNCIENPNTKHIEISFFKENRSDNYSRCIYYDKNYSNVFEFCYLLESMDDPNYFWFSNPASSVEWILYKLSDEEAFDYDNANEMYINWKKENKKE